MVDDCTFDAICKTLLVNWDRLHHRLKDLITTSDLEAGTGMGITCDSVPHLDRLVRTYPGVRLRDVFGF